MRNPRQQARSRAEVAALVLRQLDRLAVNLREDTPAEGWHGVELDGVDDDAVADHDLLDELGGQLRRRGVLRLIRRLVEVGRQPWAAASACRHAPRQV